MMITSAQNGQFNHYIGPRTGQEKNRSLVQSTKQHIPDEHSAAAQNETTSRISSPPQHIPSTPCLSVSTVSSPSTCNSAIWTKTSGLRSRSGSTHTTDFQHGSCSTAETSFSVFPAQSSTNSHVATKRRKKRLESKSTTGSHRRLSSLSNDDCNLQEITGVLDPFLSLPLDLLPQDRILLQYCE